MRSPVLEDDDFDSRPTLTRVPPPVLLELTAEDFARGWVARTASRAPRRSRPAQRSRALGIVIGAAVLIMVGGATGIGAAVVRRDAPALVDSFRDHAPLATLDELGWRSPAAPPIEMLPPPPEPAPTVAVATAAAPRVASKPPASHPVTFVPRPVVPVRKAPVLPAPPVVKSEPKPIATTTTNDNPYETPASETTAPTASVAAPAPKTAPPETDGITDKYDP